MGPTCCAEAESLCCAEGAGAIAYAPSAATGAATGRGMGRKFGSRRCGGSALGLVGLMPATVARALRAPQLSGEVSQAALTTTTDSTACIARCSAASLPYFRAW